ncbi:porin family protein [Photobacterium sp. DNB22_13_2]
MKRLGLVATLLLCAAPASADLLGISVGATVGGARVEYKGNDDTGVEYGINGAYHFNDIFSVNAGVVQGSADVDAPNQLAKNEIDYTSFPLTLRADLPLVIGSVYGKLGTNYYDYDVDQSGQPRQSEDGWGFAGGAGVVFSMLPFVDLSLNYEYRDMGDVTNNSILFGVSAGL